MYRFDLGPNPNQALNKRKTENRSQKNKKELSENVSAKELAIILRSSHCLVDEGIKVTKQYTFVSKT